MWRFSDDGLNQQLAKQASVYQAWWTTGTLKGPSDL
jgi:hypothetical protein